MKNLAVIAAELFKQVDLPQGEADRRALADSAVNAICRFYRLHSGSDLSKKEQEAVSKQAYGYLHIDS